jgi:hypothetical protein
MKDDDNHHWADMILDYNELHLFMLFRESKFVDTALKYGYVVAVWIIFAVIITNLFSIRRKRIRPIRE